MILAGMMTVSGNAMSINANAADERNAISVGVKDCKEEGKIGDFTTNVKNARNIYATISTITNSNYTTKPTTTKLQNYLTSKSVIFLNGHGDPTQIKFVYKNDAGEKVECGIKRNSTETGYVNLSNCNLSKVELICFVGCSTGNEDDGNSMAEAARKKGAKAAVGFNQSIHSRSPNGEKWLKAFNGYLAEGFCVAQAATYANSDSPNSDLGKSVVIRGNGSIMIAPRVPASRSVDHTISEFNISLSFEQVNGKTQVSESDLQNIITEITKIDETFNPDDYKMNQNIFCEEEKTGMIKFVYCIDGLIETNKSFVVYIENSHVKEILSDSSQSLERAAVVNESDLVDRVNNFRNGMTSTQSALADFPESAEREISYLYDYKTNTLTYLETVVYYDEQEEVFVDDFVEIVIP